MVKSSLIAKIQIRLYKTLLFNLIPRSSCKFQEQVRKILQGETREKVSVDVETPEFAFSLLLTKFGSTE